MTPDQFNSLLHSKTPPQQEGKLVEILWYLAKQDWHRAHEIVQQIGTKDASWIHAYLHRKEGDMANAGYWYRKAGKETPEISTEEELTIIIEQLLPNS